MRNIVIILSLINLVSTAQAELEKRPRRATYYPAYSTNHVRDFSGNGNTATNYGVDLVETSDGWVGEFDGVSNNITTGGDIFNHMTNNMTVSVFIYQEADTFASIMAKDLQVSDRSWLLYTQGTFETIKAAVWDGSGAVISLTGPLYSYSVGEWNHVTLVIAETVASLYMNGIVVAEEGKSAGIQQTGSDVYVGLRTPLNAMPFNGKMRQACIYDQAITSNDVYTLSQDGTITNKPIAKWTMQPSYR